MLLFKPTDNCYDSFMYLLHKVLLEHDHFAEIPLLTEDSPTDQLC